MNQTNKKPNNWILTIFFLQATANIVILLNMPIARQIIAFIYFTFIPGYTLIKLLRMKMESLTETVLFSAGLSITTLMLIGLIVNEFHSLFTIQKPLSLTFLLPIINGFAVTCAIIAYLRNKNENANENIDFNLKNAAVTLILICIPALSIIGAITSGTYGDNRILLFTIIAIATVFIITVITRKVIPAKLYPFIILIIAISLIYHSVLVSEKMITFGSDLTGEVFAQKIVERNSYWNPKNPYPGDQSVGRTYAMLSVTILPTIYSILLNLDSTMIFKLFYPFLFALVPLGLYNLWKKFVNEKFAFISAFFFMSFQPFYTELLGLNKQMIGELFMVLLLTVILNEKKDKNKKFLCSLIFSFGLVVSHYALAEIFLFFISSVFLASIATRKTSRKVTPTFILYFFTIMFVWYIFTSSSSVYDAFITFGQRVYNELSDFFNLQSREPEVLRGLGLEPPPTIWNLISRIFAYATEALIVIGFVSIILKRTKIYLNKEYFFLVFTSMLFLGLLIIVPGLANVMNMTRFYNVLLFFLAPLCALGAYSVTSFIIKRNIELKTFILLLVVLVPYFLFQTNFVYEMTGNYSWSIPLSKYRMSTLRLLAFGYFNDYNVFGAQWTSSNFVGYRRIYSDYYARNELRGYGLIYLGYVEPLSNATRVRTNEMIYLNPLNTIECLLIGSRLSWNITKIDYLSSMNKLYSNGGSEVYKGTP